MLSRFLPGLALAAVLPAAWACSTCKCGDYTLTLMGSEKPYDQRLRFAADLLSRSEAAGEPGLSQARTDEQRLSLGVSYALNPDWTLALRLPYVRKQLEEANLARTQTQGWGDADLLARRVLYRSPGAVTGLLGGLSLGLRLPTSERIRDGQGVLVDIDAQPDAGATAPQLGVWASRFAYPWMFNASATYFRYGKARQGFDPGDAVTGSLLGQFALDQDWALQLGLDARHAQRNRFSGAVDDDSGGTLVMAQAGLAVRAGPELLLHLNAQQALRDRLNGEQEEDFALRLGFAFDLH